MHRKVVWADEEAERFVGRLRAYHQKSFLRGGASGSYHAYQAAVFPTSIRARAVGFVYSFSRLSAIFTSFMIAYFSSRFGNPGVFAFVAASMVIAALTIGAGPSTRGLTLERISIDAV